MDELDLNLVSDAEYAQYKRLGEMDSLPRREQLAELRAGFKRTFVTLAAWAVITVALVVAAAVYPGGMSGPILWAGIAVMLGGIVPIGVVIARDSARWARVRRAAYLEQIGYAARTSRRSGAADAGSDDDRVLSRREMQAAWYPDRPNDLNWHDRQIAEIYGMDADTYESNYRD